MLPATLLQPLREALTKHDFAPLLCLCERIELELAAQLPLLNKGGYEDGEVVDCRSKLGRIQPSPPELEFFYACYALALLREASHPLLGTAAAGRAGAAPTGGGPSARGSAFGAGGAGSGGTKSNNKSPPTSLLSPSAPNRNPTALPKLKHFWARILDLDLTVCLPRSAVLQRLHAASLALSACWHTPTVDRPKLFLEAMRGVRAKIVGGGLGDWLTELVDAVMDGFCSLYAEAVGKM